MDSYIFLYKNEKYEVVFVTNTIFSRSIQFKAKDGKIFLYASKLASQKHLINVIESHKLRLVNLLKRSLKESSDYIYIFGEQIKIIKEENGYFIEGFGSFQDEKEKEKLLFDLLNTYIARRFTYFVKLMNIEKNKYKYHIRNVKSRYGSNSLRTNKILFALSLIHYSNEMIDSVIVHELAHEFERNHSQRFYQVVYKYCPNYDELKNKMRKGIFK